MGLFIGADLLNPPLKHMWGAFYVNSPWFLIGPLGVIPKSGVMTLPAALPTLPGPYNLYIQALIGSSLSNLYVMEVRYKSPSGMVLVPGGAFDMGDHAGVGDPDELPVHAVGVDTFMMDVFEVNNDQYCEFLNEAYLLGNIEVIGGEVYRMGSWELYFKTFEADPESRISWTGSSFKVKEKGDHPVLLVTWLGAAVYANWRSTEAGVSVCYDLQTWECNFGVGGYRLPTEAEWEYAARGGEHFPYFKFPWGDTVDGSMANYAYSSDPYESTYPQTTPTGYYEGNQIPAGSDMANGYGLYDMMGNVLEWCNDWYDENYYSNSPQNNPTGPSSGINRIARGGTWFNPSHDGRCAARSWTYQNVPFNSIGFRLVLELD
ncbi:MAG: formylglycine-generating enzyme family protein [Planctomycetota bacterium]